jgi:localization factor PodJL
MGGGQAPAAMDHLKRDLERTQDSLEAVHSTLGHLVDRLTMIEGGLRPDASIPPASFGHPAQSPPPAFPPHPGTNGRVEPPQAGPTAAAPNFAPPMLAPAMTPPMPAPPMMEPPPPQAPAPGPVSLPAIVPPPP